MGFVVQAVRQLVSYDVAQIVRAVSVFEVGSNGNAAAWAKDFAFLICRTLAVALARGVGQRTELNGVQVLPVAGVGSMRQIEVDGGLQLGIDVKRFASAASGKD